MKSLKDLAYEAMQKNADVFGEVLREACFVKKNNFDYGCYTTFELLPEFHQIDVNDTKHAKHICGMLLDSDYQRTDEDIKEFIVDYKPFIYTNGDLFVSWYWEGDGTLLFIDRHSGISAINTDCKKDHGWEFVGCPKELRIERTLWKR